MTIERSRIGTMPAAPERDGETYLDFVEGVRGFTQRVIEPAVRERVGAELARYQAQHGRMPEGLDEAQAALGHLDVLKTRHRFWRSSQEMNWNAVVDAYRSREADLLAELDLADRSGPGSVEWDPNFPIPDYATRDIHVQPGGYTADALAGYVYHYGTKVFFQGLNDNDEVQIDNVTRLPVPVDGQVRRILDLGCSSGQSTTALKERFPQAEVWGIDVGAPMVRYAHKRAVELGLDVHFAQRLAEATGFPDGYFDVVHAYILFHEVPVTVAEQIVREAARITRPGGVFVVYDFPTRHAAWNTGPLGEIYGLLSARDNVEPYAGDFMNSDFEGTLARYFSSVGQGPAGSPPWGLTARVAVR
jgi:SAM-dependent methyltransferase